LWSGIPTDALARELELYASVHYLLLHGWMGKHPSEIAQELKQRKKDFSSEEVERGIARLKSHGLIK